MLRDTYTPQAKTAKMLDRAFELVESVPYQVSARWLFYKLLGEGYYNDKKDYKNQFMNAISDARKRFYKAWRPDTLIDDRRDVIKRGDGWESATDWLKAVAGAKCEIDKWQSQDNYIELWFEANAMIGQFAYYTKHITLRPMGGQPSIPYKWQAAKDLERAYEAYEKPLIVLYFGDLDEGGDNISAAIETDVKEWCIYPFEFVRCGLNMDQVRRYDVPQNFERPGAFQWESLSDEAAREIITGNVTRFFHHAVILQVEAQEEKVTAWLAGKLSELAGEWREGVS
jgi:hypothetical protein